MISEAKHEATLNPDEAARRSRRRSELYQFLSSLFWQPPSAAQVRQMKAGNFLDAETAAGTSFSKTLAGNSEGEIIGDLAVEHTRLFVGPGKHLAPYAALYSGVENASPRSDETATVARFMAVAGFEYAPGYHDQPDHISAELEFMHRILAAETEALEERDFEKFDGLKFLEVTFLADHLAEWAPAFCERLINEAGHPFYRALGGLTKSVIETDLKQSTNEGNYSRDEKEVA